MRALLALALAAGCSGSHPLKVMSLNIANGAVAADGSAPYRTPAARSAQAALVLAQAPDVVSLQEAEIGCAHSGGGDTGALVLPGEGASFWSQESDDGNGCRAGNVTWVRPGLTVVENWQVRLDYFYDVWPRVVQYVRVQDESGHQLLLAATHLSTLPQTRAVQLPEAIEFAPDVFFGDLNAQGPEIGRYVQPMHEVTAPGCIDQVWMLGPGTGYLVPATGASDHAAAAIGIAQ